VYRDSSGVFQDPMCLHDDLFSYIKQLLENNYYNNNYYNNYYYYYYYCYYY